MEKIVVFAHDHIFYKYKDEYFTRASFSDEVLKRYSEHGTVLKVICRVRDTEDSPIGYTKINNNKIRFFPTKNMRSLKGIFNIINNFNVITDIISDAQLVVIRLPSSVGLLTYFSSKIKKKKIVVEVVGNALESNFLHGSLSGKFFGIFEHFLTKVCVRNSKNVIYITDKYLQSIYPNSNKTIVLSNVSIEAKEEADIVERDIVCTNLVKIGLIGSLDVNYKGHETAIRAISILKKQEPSIKWKLYFIGSGNKEKWKKLSIELDVFDNVVYLGAVKSGKAVLNLIDTMDVMLQPSLVEAQGRSILEAMSRGVPVIASNVGGIPELLDNECLIEKKDHKGAAEKIANIIKNKKLYNFIKKQQWRKSLLYNEGIIFQRRAEFLNEIVSKN